MIVVTSFFVAAAIVAQAACTNPKVRMEWNQMSASQKSLYVQATQALAARPASGQYSNPAIMGWHDFVQTHSDQAYWAHGNAQFYPYHRAMVWQFELALVSTGIWPSNLGVPYFDWSAVSQNWWTHDIFTDQYFGEISSSDPDRCVLTGAFSKSKYQVPQNDRNRVVTGDQKCLRRNAQRSPLTDAVTITQSLAATSFVTFTSQAPGVYYDSTNYHADGHGVLGGPGGDMANPSVSPNDPIFWLHHGLVDKYWWRWQQQCEQFKQDYGGNLMRADDPMSGGTAIASSNQYVESWPFVVAQLLDTQGDTLCYTYSQSAGDLTPPPIQCPAFVKNNNTMTPPPPPPTVSTLDETWVKLMFIGMVKPKALVDWNVAANGGNAPAVVDGPVVFGRDNLNTTVHTSSSAMTASGVTNESTTAFTKTAATTDAATSTGTAEPTTTEEAVLEEEPQEEFTVLQNADGSQTVSYKLANHTVEIPSGYSILKVHHGYVDTSASGKLKRIFPTIPAIPYVPQPDAPVNVIVGANPCHLAYPELLPREYVEKMGMCWQNYQNIHNLEKMRVDEFNANNCTTLYSPSSMMYQ
ncbi:hypothetical protein BDR26DRAFT_850241 [Obelidium mucronatum]|nr:hypothetical protein BDR26DRAFT_850241 [Obelidium mucronatum]